MQQTEIIAEDERAGLPSSSGLQRIFECRACLPFTNHLRDNDLLPPDHASVDAEHGTEVHRICAQLALGEKPTGDADDISEASGLWESAQLEILKAFGKPLDELKIVVEERFWHTNLKGARIASGRFDLIAMDPSTRNAVLVDYKTGHGDVPHPISNWQMMHGAVLMAINLEAMDVTAAIVQTGHKTTVTLWTSEEIADFDEEIVTWLGIGSRIHYLEAGFQPSEHNCKYCPARLHCPRLLSDVTGAVAIAQAAPDASQMVACATTPVLSNFLAKCETVELLAKAAKAEMTARLQRGEEDAAYHLKASAPRRKVTDARRLVNAIITAGATVDDALNAMSITLGAAEGLLKGVGYKGKVAKEYLEQNCGDAITLTETEPKLTRK